jgi:hypothetical protein
MKDPAFLFYSKDWLTNTAEYLPSEKGVYIDLLCYQHQNGSLPSDINRLSKMVGLSTEEFQKVWDVICKHFEPNGQPNGQPNGVRLVNPKLNRVIGERAEKGKMNTITGTFAALLRKGKYDEKTYKELKMSFNPSEFMIYEKKNITERLTDWLHIRLKSIEDGDGNGNEYIVVDNIDDKEEEEKKEKEEKKKKEKTWRTDYKIYLAQLREEYTNLLHDQEWLEEKKKFNPGVNIPLSLEKACVEFWATEAGWKHKKKSRSQNLDWRSTLTNALSLKSNRVYETTGNGKTTNNTRKELENLRDLSEAVLQGIAGGQHS